MQTVLLWIHLLGMLGVFGILLQWQWGLPREVRDSPQALASVRLANILLLVGFLAGLILYLLLLRTAAVNHTPLSGHLHGVVGVKLILMLAVGALLGLAGGRLRRGRLAGLQGLRLGLLALLALASALGATLN